MQTIMSSSHIDAPADVSHFGRNGTELSRLLSAAVVSKTFRELLLENPASALAEGYNGQSFHLEPADHERVLAIRAADLSDFALQLTSSRNGKGKQP